MSILGHVAVWLVGIGALVLLAELWLRLRRRRELDDAWRRARDGR